MRKLKKKSNQKLIGLLLIKENASFKVCKLTGKKIFEYMVKFKKKNKKT